MKKGESISMSVIIIAAIALLVLVILAVLVLRSANDVTQGTSCTGAKGVCADDCGDLDGLYTEKSSSNGKDGGCGADQKCCIKYGASADE